VNVLKLVLNEILLSLLKLINIFIFFLIFLLFKGVWGISTLYYYVLGNSAKPPGVSMGWASVGEHMSAVIFWMWWGWEAKSSKHNLLL